MSKKNLTKISIVVIGHVDSGKSTTTGHLIYKLGGIDDRVLKKYQKESTELQKGSFCFAWVLDKMKEERERGITIDISMRKFETKKFDVTVIDAPGHRDFIKNMITGTSSADVAMLVVDAVKFEAGISENGQTREHALLAFTLGVKQMIVLVNKMDEKTVNYSQKRFNEIRGEVHRMLKKIGFKVDRVPVIPVSGFKGENIVEKSDKMKWFKGGTVLSAIDDNIRAPKRKTSKPLRLCVKDIYTISGVGTVVTGRVEYGILKKGMRVIFYPSGKVADVKSIEKFKKRIETAFPGDEVGFNVRGISKSELRRGMVVGSVDNDPPKEVKSFIAHIININHPQFKVGYSPIVDCSSAHVTCRIVKILEKVDKRSGVVLEKNPKFVKKNEAAIVEMVPMKPLVVERFSDYPSLGRFCCRDLKKTVAVGVVKKVCKKV